MTDQPRRDAEYRKLRLIADSSRARKRLSQSLAPIARIDASAQQLAGLAAHWLRRPPVIGALVFLAVLAGPGRVLRAARWIAFTLPFHPLGRRLLPVIGQRVSAWLSGRRAR